MKKPSPKTRQPSSSSDPTPAEAVHATPVVDNAPRSGAPSSDHTDIPAAPAEAAHEAAPDPAPPSFAELGLCAALQRELAELGYEEPTPIQRAAIPPLLGGRDLLGQAATGTGKTAAFALPLLQALTDGASARTGADAGRPMALILVPTRELAMQVAQALFRYGRALGVRVLPIYGGQPMPQQLRALQRGVDVVVATPGRALDHMRRQSLDISAVRLVVLDEADEMLDMGFAEDLEAILTATPEGRQTALFSATMPAHIAGIARRHLRDPVHVRIAPETTPAGSVPRVRQTAFIVQRAYKIAALDRILEIEAPTAALVFCRTRTEVDELVEVLKSHGHRAEALHGGLSQEQRDRVMKLFRAGTAELLIATDVAARGLDINHLSHVINFDVPSAPEAYVHRIGRTGRAGREGVAITILEPREHRLLRNLEYATRQKITLATVPTVADLRARRLELTRGALREALLAGELDRFRVVVESLAEEFDLMDIACAAIKLAAQSAGADDDTAEDIPAPPQREPFQREAFQRDHGQRRGDIVRLYVGAGRRVGVRPQDLVGAIANEGGIPGRAIGAIEIADQFALVEIPAALSDRVLSGLRNLFFKGRRITVRLWTEDSR